MAAAGGSKRQKKAEDLWALLEEISGKQNWYEKVFEEEIVAVWRSELPPTTDPNLLDLALGLLRATAQGTKHIPDCMRTWEEGKLLCNDCESRIKEDLMRDPTSHGLNADLKITEEWFTENPDWVYDLPRDHRCYHPRCGCTPADSTLPCYVEYLPDGVLSKEQHARAKQVVAELAAKEPVDWHPGSDNQVRDLIHPSLFCYVKGVSAGVQDASKPLEPACDESEQFQWLPAEVEVSAERRCKFASYINNLDPAKHPDFTPLAEEVLDAFVAPLEKVLHMPLGGRKLQVIVKVASILLTAEKPTYKGGSWHIEGMPYEHIAATCLHYVDVQNITESFLEFRKPVILHDEDLDYPQSDGVYTTLHYGIKPGDHHEGTMNRFLGLVRCHEGASVVFPNTLQHHVKDFTLAPGAASAVRTILAFFVIDPNRRIVSSADVPRQQGIMSLEQANYYRERLMYHRKYFVQQLNEEVFERPFSLCEH